MEKNVKRHWLGHVVTVVTTCPCTVRTCPILWGTLSQVITNSLKHILGYLLETCSIHLNFKAYKHMLINSSIILCTGLSFYFQGRATQDIMEAAVAAVLTGLSLRRAASEYQVNYRTLLRYVKIHREKGSLEKVGYKKVRQVFPDEMEDDLVAYIKHAARIYNGVCPQELRVLAYKYAISNGLRIPDNWNHTGEAGPDWMKSFMKRHPDISLRTPEATSIQRMANFNEQNVKSFFENLEKCLERGFGPECIWNVDETGVTTVQRPPRILAQTGMKQVGSAVSQERGTLVTVCCAVNALGNCIPPYFVFPRVHVQPHWKLTAPPGSGISDHPSASGWMTCENFMMYMEHFVQYAKPSAEHPVLLIIDNHKSHISIEVINFAKDHHIALLSFPPHCSHEMQPLDKSVYGPFKTFVNQACDRWMREKENAGKSMSIHNIPSVVSYAFPKAMTPTNITAGFRATGIYPYDRNIFPPEKFLPASTTDRPLPAPAQPRSDGEAPALPRPSEEAPSSPYLMEKSLYGPYLTEMSMYSPYPVEKSLYSPYPVEKSLYSPYPVENSLYSPYPVENSLYSPYPVEKSLYSPYPVENSLYSPYPVEKSLYSPYLVEKSLYSPYPVEKSLYSPYPVENSLYSPYPVEKSLYSPYLVEKSLYSPYLVEKSLYSPYPVEKSLYSPYLVEKSLCSPYLVEKSLYSPYPVEKSLYSPYPVEKSLYSP